MSKLEVVDRCMKEYWVEYMYNWRDVNNLVLKECMPGTDINLLAARRVFRKDKKEVGRCMNNTMTDQRRAMNNIIRLAVGNKNKNKGRVVVECMINNLEGVDSWKIPS